MRPARSLRRALRPDPWRLVMEATLDPNPFGRPLWVLDLACGHTTGRRARLEDRIDIDTGEAVPTPTRAPRKVRCEACGESRRTP